MKRYAEWLGLFAVSGCLALMIHGAALAHHPTSGQPTGTMLTTELRATIGSSHKSLHRP